MKINLLKLWVLFLSINTACFIPLNAQSVINEIEQEKLQLIQNEAIDFLNGFKYALNQLGIMNMSINDRKAKINSTIYQYFDNNTKVIIDDDLLMDRRTNNEKSIEDYLNSITYFFNTNNVKFNFNNLEISNLYKHQNTYFFILKYNKLIEGKAKSNGNMLSSFNVGRIAQINYNPSNNKLIISSLLNQPYACKQCKEVPIVKPKQAEQAAPEDPLVYIKEEAAYIVEDYGYALNALGKINLSGTEKTAEVNGTIEQFFTNAYITIEDDFVDKDNRVKPIAAKEFLNKLTTHFIEQDVRFAIDDIQIYNTRQTDNLITLETSFNKTITGKLRSNFEEASLKTKRLATIVYDKNINTCAIKAIKNATEGIKLPEPPKRPPVVEQLTPTKPTLSEEEFEVMLSEAISKRNINTNGTPHALKSVIIPGWGNYVVGNKKQVGKIVLVTGTTVACFGTAYFASKRSQQLYDDYALIPLEDENREDTYKQADLMNKLSIATGVAGGLFWTTDIIAALIKGSKNAKRLEQFKQEFRNDTAKEYNISLQPQLSPNAVGITLKF